MNMHTPLDANQRRAILRRAIAAHPGWEAYRTSNGLGTVATIGGVAQAEEICRALGLDPVALVAAEGHAAPETPRQTPVKAAPVADAPDDVTGALIALKKALGGSVDADAVRAIVEEAVAPLRAIVADAAPVLLVIREGQPERKVEGLRHKSFDLLLKAMSARDTSGRPLSIWLAGPSQSGKTTAAEKAAEALGLSFGFHGAMTMAHELVGFVDASGRYHETPFVRAFRNGGVCLLDETDAGSNEALLALNAALANGLMSLPSGEIVKRHPDFVCIGAANTWGSGATADYIGRAKIDGAFLQRFPVKLTWDYDERLEANMCGNPDFARRVQKARDKAKTAGLKILITPAHSKAGAALVAAGFSEDEAARITYLAGLTPEQIKQVEG
jgi:hypothetical protein